MLAIEDGMATITLRRPEMANRISRSDLHLIRGYMAEVNAAQTVRVRGGVLGNVAVRAARVL